MSDLRNYIAFIIFLHDYWLESDDALADLSEEDIAKYYDKWNKEWLPELHANHSGDCIKAPAPCTRCHLESLFESADKMLKVMGKNKNINIK